MTAKNIRRNGSNRATAQCQLKIDGEMGTKIDGPMAANKHGSSKATATWQRTTNVVMAANK
jgi:hypothetical protein